MHALTPILLGSFDNATLHLAAAAKLAAIGSGMDAAQILCRKPDVLPMALAHLEVGEWQGAAARQRHVGRAESVPAASLAVGRTRGRTNTNHARKSASAHARNKHAHTRTHTRTRGDACGAGTLTLTHTCPPRARAHTHNTTEVL